jgi:hypothetical protein
VISTRLAILHQSACANSSERHVSMIRSTDAHLLSASPELITKRSELRPEYRTEESERNVSQLSGGPDVRGRVSRGGMHFPGKSRTSGRNDVRSHLSTKATASCCLPEARKGFSGLRVRPQIVQIHPARGCGGNAGWRTRIGSECPHNRCESVTFQGISIGKSFHRRAFQADRHWVQ